MTPQLRKYLEEKIDDAHKVEMIDRAMGIRLQYFNGTRKQMFLDLFEDRDPALFNLLKEIATTTKKYKKVMPDVILAAAVANVAQ